MKWIVRVAFALGLVACGGTNFVFESTDATSDVLESERSQRTANDGEPARESGSPEDAVVDSANVEEPADVFDASTPRDASLDTGHESGPDGSVRDASRHDSGDGDVSVPDSAPDAPVACVPLTKTVACATVQCGPVPDGCGGTHACGTCALPRVCVANACQCPTVTDATYCVNHRYNCGNVIDTCSGAQRNCGRCTGALTCGGGNLPNVCGCTPITACPLGECGARPNGCGGTLDCGTCSSPETCGGAGIPNRCGCKPLSACPDPASCGTMPDGCGGSIVCPGICSPWQICGSAPANADAGGPPGTGSCAPNVCCSPCTPTLDPTCAPLSIAFSCDPSIVLPGCFPAAGADGGLPGEGGAGPTSVVWCCH